MITFDKEKCTSCSLCVNDCITNVIEISDDGFPAVVDEAGCIKCQHCFAVCPAGAVTFNGNEAKDVPSANNFPETEQLENLMKSRRSVRKYQSKEIPWDVLKKLSDTLAYTPTGCNYHKLKLIFVTGKKADEFREKTKDILLKIIHSPLRFFMPKRYKRFFKMVDAGDDVIYRGAPAFIVVAVHKNSPCKNEDPIIALTWFELLANAMGLGCCWCGFAQRAFTKFSSLRKMLELDENYQVGSVILFGYPEIKYQREIVPEKFETKIL